MIIAKIEAFALREQNLMPPPGVIKICQLQTRYWSR